MSAEGVPGWARGEVWAGARRALYALAGAGAAWAAWIARPRPDPGPSLPHDEELTTYWLPGRAAVVLLLAGALAGLAALLVRPSRPLARAIPAAALAVVGLLHLAEPGELGFRVLTALGVLAFAALAFRALRREPDLPELVARWTAVSPDRRPPGAGARPPVHR